MRFVDEGLKMTHEDMMVNDVACHLLEEKNSFQVRNLRYLHKANPSVFKHPTILSLSNVLFHETSLIVYSRGIPAPIALS